MNHSCEPTCWFEPDELNRHDGVVVMTATRDLSPGDELTFDYATSEDVEQNWKCLCGSATCRGRVTGDDWKDPAFQAKYRGHCMPHVEVSYKNLVHLRTSHPHKLAPVAERRGHPNRHRLTRSNSDDFQFAGAHRQLRERRRARPLRIRRRSRERRRRRRVLVPRGRRQSGAR